MTTGEKIRLGQSLKIHRLEAEKELVDVATDLDVSKSHLRDVEAGDANPSFGLVYEMAELYDSSLGRILTDAGI